MGASTDVPGVKDVFDLVMVFVLDLDQGRRFGMWLGKGVWGVLLQEANMEDQVQAFES